MTILLVLMIDPALEEDLVDYLLAADDVAGFTSLDAAGHGERGAMTIAEQVTGRRRRKRFEILLDEGDVDGVLGGLADQVGRGIHYWSTPVLSSGRI